MRGGMRGERNNGKCDETTVLGKLIIKNYTLLAIHRCANL